MTSWSALKALLMPWGSCQWGALDECFDPHGADAQEVVACEEATDVLVEEGAIVQPECAVALLYVAVPYT